MDLINLYVALHPLGRPLLALLLVCASVCVTWGSDGREGS